MRLIRNGKGAVLILPRIATIVLHKLIGRSDYRRWIDHGNLETWWDTRTEKLASLIPASSRTLEFGAGRRQLESLLPSGCTYFPSDLVDRGPGTIVCDLNVRPLPDLRYLKADVAVFGGVLEYMRDIPSLAQWLAGQTPTVITSYHCIKSRKCSWGRVAELLRRSYFGYLSHYTLDELNAAFERAGFQYVSTDTWENQQLLVFRLRRLGQLNNQWRVSEQ
jgi:hypothetical protein